MQSAKAASPNPKTPTSPHSKILNLLITDNSFYVLANEHYLGQKSHLGRLGFGYVLCVYPGGTFRHRAGNKNKQIPQFGHFVLHATSSTSRSILMKNLLQS